MERYICIHGHFYQPPRENPWLEVIEVQDTAYPYHDWNERITAECYATNATSRILDEQDRILQIVNNYSRMSFNFGPTLLSWLEQEAPDVYGAILEADRQSQELFSGHGSAIAQAYNHMILPLANSADKYTQVFWGIRDFEHRFGRKPEGMWLPETAVDLETLETFAEQGIRFTILDPQQASRVRPVGDENWHDVSGGKIDPTMAYVQHLPSGRTIDLFFYDGSISRGVAFEKLLVKGETFAQRLTAGFSEERDRPQMVHIATDGETYGHHHRFGDMALAYALHHIESKGLARLTNYGEFLGKCPPTYEVEIFEKTSWSCVHGVERWWRDCGCSTGGSPGWNQAWREPLRGALDWLRDTMIPSIEEKGRSLLKDPWEGRNEYIRVVLDRSPENIENFLNQNAVRALNEEEKVTVLKLLELQRHALFMYTSCGWFFNDLSGPETVQIIQYAGRALQLAQEIFGHDLKPSFLELLERAKSNIPALGDGRQIYENFIKSAKADLDKVGAHYAMSSLFEDYGEQVAISCYRADREGYHSAQAGRAKLALGRVKVMSEITRESVRLCFGVLHWGDHNLSCSVRQCQGEEPHLALIQEISETFAKGDFPETLKLLEKHFGPSRYSLTSLFRDELRKILGIILESTLTDAESIYRQVYETNAPLMRFIKDLGGPLPKALYTAAEFVLNASLKQAFQEEALDLEGIENLLDLIRLEEVSFDADTLEMAIRRRMERMAEEFLQSPAELPLLQRLDEVAALVKRLPFELNLRKIQNTYYNMLQDAYPGLRGRAEQGDERAQEWVHHFRNLGDKLSVYVD